MESVIKKISDGVEDQSVHDEFVKFSKGKFENRYIVEGKKQKDKWAIKTSAEFANYLVRKCLEKSKEEKLQIKGAIVSTFSLAEEVKFPVENVKKYMGIQQAIINSEISKADVLEAMEKFPKVFFALSFKSSGFDLKIKAKAPKSGKPGKKGDDEGPKADFCSLKTEDKEIVEDLFFDNVDFKEAKINHTILVEDIKIPKDFKTPEEMREKAIRLGRVIRKTNYDEKKEEKEFEFKA